MCIAPTPIFRTCVHFIRRNKRRTQKTSFFRPPPSEPGRAQDLEKGPERVGLGCFFTPFWSKKPFVQKSLVLPCKSTKRVPKNVFLSFSLQFYSYFFFNYKPAARSSKPCFGTPFLTFAGANKCFLNGAKINCHFCGQFIVFAGRKLKKMNQIEYFYWEFIANFVFSFSQGFYSVFSMHEKHYKKAVKTHTSTPQDTQFGPFRFIFG